MDGNPREDDQDETRRLLKALENDAASRHDSAMKAIAASRKEDWLGYVMKVVLPVILPILLGFFVWYGQKKIETQVDTNKTEIQSKVDENNRMLQTRLALTEEFYKRKLNAYEKTCGEIANLRASLDRLRELEINPEIGQQAFASVRAVNDLRKSDLLYLSDDFKNDLGDLWGYGIDRMKVNADDDAALELAMGKVNEQISKLERRMRDDLQTGEIGRFPRQSTR
jgi:hypothetical protein